MVAVSLPEEFSPRILSSWTKYGRWWCIEGCLAASASGRSQKRTCARSYSSVLTSHKSHINRSMFILIQLLELIVQLRWRTDIGWWPNKKGAMHLAFAYTETSKWGSVFDSLVTHRPIGRSTQLMTNLCSICKCKPVDKKKTSTKYKE